MSSSATALDFTYRYAFPSAVGETEHGFGLRLATCGAQHEQPHFFDGRMMAPREMGEMLLVRSDVVRTHFFLPRPALLDPVVTSNETMLRFEGFSGCCGVYARLDIPAEAFQSDHLGRGTTNVDFNNPMRAALSPGSSSASTASPWASSAGDATSCGRGSHPAAGERRASWSCAPSTAPALRTVRAWRLASRLWPGHWPRRTRPTADTLVLQRIAAPTERFQWPTSA